jgi:hypothetical protein
MSGTPYLTLVAASRNDDHGGNPLYRTQIFVESFLEQCERHQLPAELILVEWNPPRDQGPLAEVICWDRQNVWVDCRVITVPHERHVFIRFGRVLPLFQMIAKNVGIRRARGEFILATNIDILFSDELIARVARKDFRADRLYRCDRFDVDSTIPKDVPLDEKLRFAWGNVVRRNQRSLAATQIEGSPPDLVIKAALASGHFELEAHCGLSALVAKPSIPLLYLHVHACGDFTLLHRDAWAKIGGYAEFEMFSLHLDTLGLATAHLAGFRETWFPPPAVCFHIEHAVGSGYTAENEALLFERLERQGIGWFDFSMIEAYFDEMHEKGALQFNTDAWGLRDIPLEETVCTREGIELRKVPNALQADPYLPVAAIQPQFNADRHFRLAFRRLVERAEAAQTWAKGAVARAEAAEAQAEAAQTSAKADKARAEAAEAQAKAAQTSAKADRARAEAAEAQAKAAQTSAKADKARAEAAEARAERAETCAKATEARAETAELQLRKYRRFFGSLEKLYNKVKFDWLASFK